MTVKGKKKLAQSIRNKIINCIYRIFFHYRKLQSYIKISHKYVCTFGKREWDLLKGFVNEELKCLEKGKAFVLTA